MSNRLLMNIANAINWLKSQEEANEVYKEVVTFLEQASSILQPAVEDLRGKDINHTEKIDDEDGTLMTLNDLIDHLDYIKYRDGIRLSKAVDKARLELDLARQTMRLGSPKIPKIRKHLEILISNVEEGLSEDTDDINLKTALMRMKGARNDLSNV